MLLSLIDYFLFLGEGVRIHDGDANCIYEEQGGQAKLRKYFCVQGIQKRVIDSLGYHRTSTVIHDSLLNNGGRGEVNDL